MNLLLWALWIVPFWAMWGENLRFQHGALVFNFKKGSWPNRTWYKKWGGTTLGDAIMYNHDRGLDGDRIQVHEEFHQNQFRGVMLSSLITSVLLFAVLFSSTSFYLNFLVCLVLWLTGYIRWGLGNLLYALICLKGNAYRLSSHEQAAYAVDYHFQITGKKEMEETGHNEF